MRQPQTLVHMDAQRQRFRPQLHGRGSQCIRGLEWVAPLHPSSAHRTTTDGNVKAPPDRVAHDLLLILRLRVFPLQRSTAVRTLRRRGNRDRLIDLFGNALAVMMSVIGAGLAPGPLRVLLALAARKRRRLPFAGTPLLLQFLPPLPQLLVFLPQLFVLTTAATPLLLKGSDSALQFFDYSSRLEGLQPRHRSLSQLSVTEMP